MAETTPAPEHAAASETSSADTPSAPAGNEAAEGQYDAVASPDDGDAPGEAPAEAPEGRRRKVVHHQADGRYIPYSGGSLGWHENSGVLKSETVNGYRFSTAMDAQMVRIKESQRTGKANEKRRSQRRAPPVRVPVSLKSEAAELPGRVLDISEHGARVQHIEVEYAGNELGLGQMDNVVCRFPGPNEGESLLDLQCVVIRTEKSGLKRPVWSISLDFAKLSDEQAATLARLAGFAA